MFETKTGPAPRAAPSVLFSATATDPHQITNGSGHAELLSTAQAHTRKTS